VSVGAKGEEARIIRFVSFRLRFRTAFSELESNLLGYSDEE